MERKSETEKDLEKGLDSFLKYREECKRVGKKPVSLQQFFRKYDPITLEPSKGIPPLRKYVQRYYREIKKMQEKAEGK